MAVPRARSRWQTTPRQAPVANIDQAAPTPPAGHTSLEYRVADLTAALSDSRAALQTEFGEKQRLATRLNALLEALPGGVVVLDGGGRVAECNPAARELLGDIAVGEPWVAVVARTFAPRWDDGHDVSLVDGRRVNVATAALGTEPGQILLIKDVTQTRRLQDQLDHHRRLSAKTELAAVLAHQVRTPLATALLQLGNLNRAGLAPEAQQRARSKALDAMRQLERLVEDMLSYARGGVLEAEPIRVQHLLDIVEQSVAAQQDDDAFTFELRRPETDVWISGNRSALLSIILNLVNNARAATAGRGRLRLDLTVDSAELICRFSDNGPGIAPANRSQIFEPFFTTRQNGTGLGLSVARAIARAHAGDLELDETALEGACFVLRLPLTPGVER